MKILVLAAMDKEIVLLKKLLRNCEFHENEDLEYWEGTLGKNKVFLSKCGIGKVNSALNTLREISILKPDIVINSGVAGGAGLPVGSLLIADKIAYHDVWCGPGTEYGQADANPLFFIPTQQVLDITRGKNLFHGLICSGDKFISKPEEIKFIKSKFPDVKAVDMESAAIAHTCSSCGIPFAVIRVVSDTPGEGENLSQYKDFWTTAPEKTFAVLSEIIEELK